MGILKYEVLDKILSRGLDGHLDCLNIGDIITSNDDIDFINNQVVVESLIANKRLKIVKEKEVFNLTKKDLLKECECLGISDRGDLKKLDKKELLLLLNDCKKGGKNE